MGQVIVVAEVSRNEFCEYAVPLGIIARALGSQSAERNARCQNVLGWGLFLS
jgi:hypothetical protein